MISISLIGENIKFFHDDGTLMRIGETSKELNPDGWLVNATSISHEIIIPFDADLLLDGVDLNIGDNWGELH